MKTATGQQPLKRRRSALAPAAFSLALLAGLAPTSVAFAAIHPGDATIRYREVTLHVSEQGARTVSCPSGMRVVSGGTYLHRSGHDTEAAPQSSTVLLSSAPTTDGKGWRGAARIAGLPTGIDSLQMRVTAVCLPVSQVGSYTLVTRDLTVDLGRARGSVGCGSGMRVVTGGARWRHLDETGHDTGEVGSDNLMLSSPTTDGKRWRANGFTYSAEHARLRIILLCRPTAALGAFVVRQRDLTPSGPETIDGTVTCPAGYRALAGGVDWYHGNVPSNLAGNLASSSVTGNDTGWYGAGYVSGTGDSLHLTVLCRPK